MEDPGKLVDRLVPRPRSVKLQDGVVPLTDAHSAWLESAALEKAAAGKLSTPAVELTLTDAVSGDQSYELTVNQAGIAIAASDEAGLYYGFCTLRQLARLSGAALPALTITDGPDFTVRGVMLDISRDKVPTIETLKQLIDELAGLKINQLQLYMEHTFAYAGHEAVWENASPLTGDDVRALDDYCAARHIDLVPNQNSFGHMHRWLIHEPYRQIAECPEGIEHVFSPRPEPFGLCPTDSRSIDLLKDLYAQLLPNFRSALFNVGLDETIDLGKGRSATDCRARGAGRVYLEFIQAIHSLVTGHDRTMMFWGDIILGNPELIGELPKDAVVLIWGYEANSPFERKSKTFADAGLPFYVCPGTSSWNSLGGRVDNALANLANAARAGFSHGAEGFLITDWGDFGHLQPLPVSYPGLVAGAAFSWRTSDAAQPNAFALEQALSDHLLMDANGSMSRALVTLGNVYQLTGMPMSNQSLLFNLLVFPERIRQRMLNSGVGREQLSATRSAIDGAACDVSAGASSRDDAELLCMELTWVADALRLAVDIGIEDLSATHVNSYSDLIAGHRRNWLWRNRPGGLPDSVGRLQRVVSLVNEIP